eukprot:CAMPEP_0174752220 /NCGR_PEP_ID=MMETSP1094-20130205/101552_1 /TAXON_ID=156173 /ORGANISM="Chrysochromulina brevifilum, Strain UTEX LB 985" /LENGTH=245 /DNA_ID=CAMNT_0015957829 /DNA_START=40 /DNA_END=774 /DNA_ORIENTATION=+
MPTTTAVQSAPVKGGLVACPATAQATKTPVSDPRPIRPASTSITRQLGTVDHSMMAKKGSPQSIGTGWLFASVPQNGRIKSLIAQRSISAPTLPSITTPPGDQVCGIERRMSNDKLPIRRSAPETLLAKLVTPSAQQHAPRSIDRTMDRKRDSTVPQTSGTVAQDFDQLYSQRADAFYKQAMTAAQPPSHSTATALATPSATSANHLAISSRAMGCMKSSNAMHTLRKAAQMALGKRTSMWDHFL